MKWCFSKIRTDGTERTEIISGEFGDKIIVINDWIYYSNHGDTYRIRVDGTDNTKFIDESIHI